MELKKYFLYNPTFDLTACQIGINKWDWSAIQSENEAEAKLIMQQKKFDVLPINNEDGKIMKYYSTETWNNYDNLNLKTIDHANSVYFRLGFGDLVRKFKLEKRHFYFLTNYREVLGLVSFVNFNCQAVYNYLFQIISDLELSINHLLKKYIEQKDIVDVFLKSQDKHLNEVVQKFKKSEEMGTDNTIFEHMYLQTISIVLNKFNEKLPDELRKLNNYSRKFASNGVYNNLRNRIMHPVRPILSDQNTISEIDELLNDYLEIKDILG